MHRRVALFILLLFILLFILLFGGGISTRVGTAVRKRNSVNIKSAVRPGTLQKKARR